MTKPDLGEVAESENLVDCIINVAAFEYAFRFQGKTEVVMANDGPLIIARTLEEFECDLHNAINANHGVIRCKAVVHA